MAYQTPRIIDVSGRTITIAHLELPQHPATILTADVAAAGTALTVLDNAGFAQNQKLLIGQLGKEQTELKVVNAAVSAGTSLTSTAVTFAHSIGSPLKRMLFDQWRLYGNSTNTTVGATLIATIDVQVDAPSTTYVNTGTEYTYYFVLAYDSVAGITSTDYSDGVINATSYTENSVGSLINASLDDAKAKMNEKITTAWFLRNINECLTFITGKLKRWSFLQHFDYSLGSSLRGSFQYTLPTDITDANSPKSILGVRVGTGSNLLYLDKTEWEVKLRDVSQTQVRTEASATDTTLDVDNSYDFNDTGSVSVYVSGTKYTLTYTGVTRSTTAGVLTGIPASGTGSISVTIPVDTNVWQGEDEGQPSYFRVDDGSLYIYPLPDGSNDYKNVTLDYYTKKTAVDSMSDTVEPPRYDAIKHWLTWKLRSQNNASGQLDMTDGDKVMFDTILTDMIRHEISGQKARKKRNINGIFY